MSLLTLALETSERIGSIAALNGDQLLVEFELPGQRRCAQSLAPTIQTLLHRVPWQTDQINLVAVVSGPGSFTGLRIGVTTAKTLAYAVGADVLGVNTLETIADRAPVTAHRLWTIVDAQRQQVFASRFEPNDAGQWQVALVTTILDAENWLEMLTPGDLVSGPALANLAGKLPDNVTIVDQQLWLPTAVVAGRLAVERYQRGERDDLWKLVPNYFRQSAAEEKWEKTKGEGGRRKGE